jgi:hypothetical protein
MNKFALILVLFSVMAGNVFGEFNWTFYGKGVFAPLAISGEASAVSAATATYDNHARPRVGFTLAANNEANTIGMNAVFNWDGRTGDVTNLIGENAYIWVKPLGPFEGIANTLKIIIGKFEVDDFYGRIGAAEFASWITPEGSKDEAAFFTRIKSTAGAHITLKPLAFWNSSWNQLSLEAAVGSTITGERAFMNLIGWSAADVFAAAQAVLGYQIPKTGLARVQIIVNNRQVYLKDYPFKGHNETLNLSEGLATNQDSDVIEAAFLYDGIKNLQAEIGAKIPLAYTTDLANIVYYPGVYNTNIPYQTKSPTGTDTLEVQQPYTIALGASYIWQDLNILARVDISIGGKYVHVGERTITLGAGMGFMASADWRFASPLRVGLDIAFNYHEMDTEEKIGGATANIGERKDDKATSERKDFGFAPWIAVDLGGGVFKLGVAVMLPSSPRWNYAVTGIAGDDGWRPNYSGKPIISIPLSITYRF